MASGHSGLLSSIMPRKNGRGGVSRLPNSFSAATSGTEVPSG